MTEKILYYLGAGTSANAYPLAKCLWKKGDTEDKTLLSEIINPPEIAGLTYSMFHLVQELTKDVYSPKVAGNTGLLNAFKKLRNFDFTILYNVAREAWSFGDIDSYAKYLYIRGEHEQLNMVKKALAQYFIITQLFLKRVERRYIPWLVGLMDNKVFPENVKILSWNYDFQVEAAAYYINDEPESITHNRETFIHSPGFFRTYPSLDPSFHEWSETSLIHMNGIAGYRRNSVNGFTIIDSPFSQAHDLDFLWNYLSQSYGTEYLHFSWERNTYSQAILNAINALIDGTTIIVVIGYSFPYYNREIDKKIFEKLINRDDQGNYRGTLKKIYFQDPSLNGQQLRTQFNLPEGIEIVHISQVDNFHIPYEY